MSTYRDIDCMHRQLDRHARKEAFRFKKNDVDVLRVVFHLWISLCTCAVHTLASICGLLVSVHPVREGVQWFFRRTLEIQHTVCRLLHSEDLAHMHPGQKIQLQDFPVLAPLAEAYACALRAHLEDHCIPAGGGEEGGVSSVSLHSQ